jgi:RNA polymerase sigma-70 factor (ECF subfamily)
MRSEQTGALQQLLQFHRGDAATFESAFESLFHQHQSAVYGWILRIVRNPSAAEDLTIETFWRIHQARMRFDPERGFEAWSRRIATRAALDWLRAQRPESGMSPEYFDALSSPPSTDPAITAEVRLKTAQAFSRLPPKLRIAAILAVVEERPQREVADALGISVTAVKVRVFRALRLLRKDLEHQGIKP